MLLVVSRTSLRGPPGDFRLTHQNAFFILMLAAWGCIGITQTSFGFHHVWEFWAYQAFYGLFVCPWYAISVSVTAAVTDQRALAWLTSQQAMISEVVPRGKEARPFFTHTPGVADLAVPILCSILHYRQDVIVHRTIRIVGHHRSFRQRKHAIHVPSRPWRLCCRHSLARRRRQVSCRVSQISRR